MLKFNCEKDQLLLKLEGIKEERLKHVNEKIDAIYNKQQQLKFYLQVCIVNFIIIRAQTLEGLEKWHSDRLHSKNAAFLLVPLFKIRALIIISVRKNFL